MNVKLFNYLASMDKANVPTQNVSHYLLFAGHMVDKNDRSKTRFPANKEATAKSAIKQSVEAELKRVKRPVAGIAGGACGGDILFHEVCEELGIPTELFLALPKDEFIEASVAFAGQHWVNRFNKVYDRMSNKVLAPENTDKHNVWERANLWMLESALRVGGQNITLIVLWDGKGGDGVGGTEHMVNEASRQGANIVILNTRKLFNL